MADKAPLHAPHLPPEVPITILCVDDDALVLSLYHRALSRAGYRVLTSRSGKATLDIMRQEDVGLLLIDIGMPDMSGLDVIRTLRRDPNHTPCPTIVISAFDSEECVMEGLSLGIDDYLVKPVGHGELLAKVTMILKKRRLARLTASGLSLGDTIAGRYEILGNLGAGGFATVYLARDQMADPPRQVAIKTFHGDRAATPDFVSRFLREAYAHCRLKHPNIVCMHNFGQRDNLYYLVMEYLDGLNLEEILATSGNFDQATAHMVAVDVLHALHYLHEHDLMHRDIKLRNILITRQGITKVLDFGLSRRIDEQTLSNSDRMSGTPLYISPEYIRGSDAIDIRTDVYSLGITIYRLLAGRHPYPDSSPLEMVHHHLHTPPLPIIHHRPDITTEFAAAIDSMLCKERDQRPLPAALLQRLEPTT